MDQQQPYQPNQPITVTLEAQEWNVVFLGLGEVPLKLAGPVSAKIRMQIQPPAPAAPANGEDRPDHLQPGDTGFIPR